MSQEIICINDVFSEETRRKVKNLPVEGHIDTIRAVRRNADGSYGILLDNIVNPTISAPTEYGFWVKMEPNFHPSRFVNLDNTPLTIAMLDEIMSSKELVKK